MGGSDTLVSASKTSARLTSLNGGVILIADWLTSTAAATGGGAVGVAPGGAAAVGSAVGAPLKPASAWLLMRKLIPRCSGSRFRDSSRKLFSTSLNGKS